MERAMGRQLLDPRAPPSPLSRTVNPRHRNRADQPQACTAARVLGPDGLRPPAAEFQGHARRDYLVSRACRVRRWLDLASVAVRHNIFTHRKEFSAGEEPSAHVGSTISTTPHWGRKTGFAEKHLLVGRSWLPKSAQMARREEREGGESEPCREKKKERPVHVAKLCKGQNGSRPL